MTSKDIQESKQEPEAAIRYAENAISKANQTIESMATYQDQTGREEALTKQVQELEERNDGLNAQVADLNVELQRQQGLGQGYYDSMMSFKDALDELGEERNMLEKNVKYLRDENKRLKIKVEEYTQNYCKLSLGMDAPTMPVIPKAVAIAIFREGMAQGVEVACSEIENTNDIEISETGYTGDFEVSFSKYIDLSEHLDLDWMRDKVGDYSEEFVIDALGNLCADNEFECRIHGVDDQEKDNSSS